MYLLPAVTFWWTDSHWRFCMRTTQWSKVSVENSRGLTDGSPAFLVETRGGRLWSLEIHRQKPFLSFWRSLRSGTQTSFPKRTVK